MKRIKEYIVESIEDGYAVEAFLRNISFAIAGAAICSGIVILLCGW